MQVEILPTTSSTPKPLSHNISITCLDEEQGPESSLLPPDPLPPAPTLLLLLLSGAALCTADDELDEEDPAPPAVVPEDEELPGSSRSSDRLVVLDGRSEFMPLLLLSLGLL